MRSKGWVRRALSVGLLVVVLGLAWVAFRGYQVLHDLQEADDDTTEVQQALFGGDDQASDAALDQLLEHSQSAADRSSGPTWDLLTHVPFLGDDARAVQLASDTLAELTRDGVAPLTASGNRLDNLLPRDGRIAVARLATLDRPVRAGQDAVARAEARLAETDPDGLVAPVRERYTDLVDRVDAVSGQLDVAATALRVMPSLLGAEGPRDYLLVFQNNAEVRSTGGLPGAVALLHVDDGRLSLVRQVPGQSFGELPEPVLPLTSEEKAIYGAQLGTFFVDANFTPDFPRTAELMKARWERDNPETIDGVISLDPVVLSYILGATGPLPLVGGELNSGNAVDRLLHEVYTFFSDGNEQDEFFQRVAQGLFDMVSTGSGSPEDLLRALGRGVREDRVYLHFFDEAQQQALTGRAVAGELVTDPKADPQVGFYVDDATGAKMSYYLRFDVEVDATACDGGRQDLVAQAGLRSLAPADAASQPTSVTGGGAFGTAPGTQLDLLHIYGPVGGTITSMTLDGKPLDFEAHTQEGRPVANVVVSLEPGQRTDLTWKMRTGAGQTGDVDVSVTPGVDPVRKSSTVRSACAGG